MWWLRLGDEVREWEDDKGGGNGNFLFANKGLINLLFKFFLSEVDVLLLEEEEEVDDVIKVGGGRN